MPVARRNIELTGGTIKVESERGRGTTVTIALPVEDAATANSQLPTPKES